MNLIQFRTTKETEEVINSLMKRNKFETKSELVRQAILNLENKTQEQELLERIDAKMSRLMKQVTEIKEVVENLVAV